MLMQGMRRQAWDYVDEIYQSHETEIDNNPLLLYALARVRYAQGESELVDKLTEAALDRSNNDPGSLFRWASECYERGWIRWAEDNYRRLLEHGNEVDIMTLRARALMGEIVYDRGQVEEAAEHLEKLIAGMEKAQEQNPDKNRGVGDFDLFKARYHFFRGTALADAEQYDQAWEQFEKAVSYDIEHVVIDALIAMYRLPGRTDEQLGRVVDQIEQMAEQYRANIRNQPEVAVYYNQLAWLVANTQGDQDEALAASKKSIELSAASNSEDRGVPEPGYLDTLGRCYYAQKQYEKAVEVQTRAVQMEPQSGAMTRQLRLFSEALAAEQGGRAEDPAGEPAEDSSAEAAAGQPEQAGAAPQPAEEKAAAAASDQ